MNVTKTAFAVALGLSAFVGSVQAAGTDLFAATAAKANRTAKDASLVQQAQSDAKVERLAVKTLKAALSNKTRELNLNLLPGVNFSAKLKEAKKTADGSLIWVGKPASDLILANISDAGADRAILVQREGRITGNVVVAGQLYTIRPLANGEHIVTQVDESRFPADHPEQYSELVSSARLRDSLTAATSARATQTNAVNATGNTVLKLMVNWTQGAAAQVTDMTALINLAMTETNQGYANSGIALTAELVHGSAVNYTESGVMTTDRDRYANNNDGYMDGIHALRDQHSADVGVLILNNTQYCGVASAIGATQANAFAVVHYDCATGYYSFAHEVGHLQGARHDPANDPTTTPYAYGHGYQAPNKAWRTVMGYNCSPSCTRINYWSNPLKTYTDGQAMGTASQSDNARVLNTTATTVANFRNGRTAMLSRLYRIGLNREPDAAGWGWWANTLNSGTCNQAQAVSVTSTFFGSGEFTGFNLSKEEQLKRAYRVVLNREPDAAGYQYWLGQMYQGATVVDVVKAFGNSGEFANTVLPQYCAQ